MLCGVVDNEIKGHYEEMIFTIMSGGVINRKMIAVLLGRALVWRSQF